MNKTDIILRMKIIANSMFDKEVCDCGDKEIYSILLTMIKEMANQRVSSDVKKKIYYISAEFLIGKLLSNNLINLGIYNEVSDILSEYGKSVADIEELEPEPSLGNGGLGRLAACFLDSGATCDLALDGIGLNYHYGLFKQEFHNFEQTTLPNPWIEDKSWLNKTDVTYKIEFGDCSVVSRMYDIDVLGYGKGHNKLHLFDIESIDEELVEESIVFDKSQIDKNLTLFLYPDDSDESGNLLRIYQEYFMVSNGARLILKELIERGGSYDKLDEYVAIQINDTHPTMVIPELIRLLTQESDLSMDKAIEVVSKTCAYTNHTILSEALERWPLRYIEKVAPKLIPIIKELDNRIKSKVDDRALDIIDSNNIVHMAHIDIHYGYSINGVAAIHTKILMDSELRGFYNIYPNKFNNKTNGITIRRWLQSCNKELADLITSTIGNGYVHNADKLKDLLAHIDDVDFLQKLARVKHNNKLSLAKYILAKESIDIDVNSIYDIQIKRMHEYKRQQMNALYIIHKYISIKKGLVPPNPITFIFGAKAAPAYIIAQDVIHLILVMAKLINEDPQVNKYMKVVMVENYNVSYAERLIPACDISEQISLASKEASGTGNMKFMLNGAVTLGTSDGANVEINELVGDDNIYIFGEKSEQIIGHYANKDYISKDYYMQSVIIKEAVDFIISNEVIKIGSPKRLRRLYRELVRKDWFMTLLDLEDYIRVKDGMIADYSDSMAWNRMALINVAQSGFFSSDRTIREYDKDIWKSI